MPDMRLTRIFVVGIVTAMLCGCGSDVDSDPGDNGRVDGGAGGADAAAGNLPQSAYCMPVADWPGARLDAEEQVLALVNQARAQGADCGSKGSFGPTDALAADPALRCAAQMHSLDMYERDYFDHVNPDGQQPWDRMELAGYTWRQAGENIASGAADAEAVIAQWMSSPGHCANIMSSDFVHIGIGGHLEARLWTQTFGRP